jgi:hypothetical protein
MKRIRLTESQLHNIIKKSINEIGDTSRGQYMLGRTAGRQSATGNRYPQEADPSDVAYQANGKKRSSAYGEGFNDESNNISRSRKDFNYSAYKMSDMDNLGKKFINFIEQHDGGVLMQKVVDYESGNQTGEKESPVPYLIDEFEDEYGIECTKEMRDALNKAYYHWWFYAEPELMADYDLDESIHRVIKESVKKILKEDKFPIADSDDDLNGDFKPHGYKTTSNSGGQEIQLSDYGDAARIKDESGNVGPWLEIDFDEDGVAYVENPDTGEQTRLDEFMRYN